MIKSSFPTEVCKNEIIDFSLASLPAHRSDLTNFQIVNNLRDLKACWRLVHDLYQEQKYTKGGTQIRLPSFIREPNAKFATTMASRRERDGELQVIGTATIVFTEVANITPLPCQAIPSFDRKINEYLGQGIKLAETTMFGICHIGDREAETLLPQILARQLKLAMQLNVMKWVGVVNPRHVPRYQRLFGAEQIDGPETCSHVNNAQGVLLSLDLTTALPKARGFRRFAGLLQGEENNQELTSSAIPREQLCSLRARGGATSDLQQDSLLRRLAKDEAATYAEPVSWIVNSLFNLFNNRSQQSQTDPLGGFVNCNLDC